MFCTYVLGGVVDSVTRYLTQKYPNFSQRDQNLATKVMFFKLAKKSPSIWAIFV